MKKLIAILKCVGAEWKYFILPVIFGMIYSVISLIYNSDAPLGWTAAVGGVFGGIGAIGAVVFAWWAILQNTDVHSYNIIKNLADSIEESIPDIVFVDSAGARHVGVEALDCIYNLYLHDYTDKTFDLIVESSNITKVCRLYSELTRKISSKKCNTKLFNGIIIGCSPTSLAGFVFLISACNKDSVVYKNIHNNELLDKFYIKDMTKPMVANALKLIIKENNTTNELIEINKLLLFIDKVWDLDKRIVEQVNIELFPPEDQCEKFNDHAALIGVKCQLKYLDNF